MASTTKPDSINAENLPSADSRYDSSPVRRVMKSPTIASLQFFFVDGSKSTLQPAFENTESMEHQYALRQRAPVVTQTYLSGATNSS